jgi:putative ABC transport system permease protein
MQMGVQTATSGDGEYTDVWLVESDYGVIHRIEPDAGRWLSDQDVDRLAPAAVVNRTLRSGPAWPAVPPPFVLSSARPGPR